MLGLELLNKWKKIDDKEDFINEANDYTINNYGIKFNTVYCVWSELLYRMICKFDREDFFKFAKLDSESLELESNISEYKRVCSDEIMYNNYKSDIDEIDDKLNNKEHLKEAFDDTLATFKKNLMDYTLENGKDDFALEWQKELDSVTIDDYIKSLIKEKNDKYENIDNMKEKLIEVIYCKKSLQWIENFLLPVKEPSDLELVNVKELGLSCLSKYGNERFNITRRLVILDEEKVKEQVTNSHTK